MVLSRAVQLDYLPVINPPYQLTLLVMDCWLPETWCGLFKTPCCLEETLSVHVHLPQVARSLVEHLWGWLVLEERPGAAAGHKEQCPVRGHLTADPSPCSLSWTGSGGLKVLTSAVLLFSFLCASQVVPTNQGKKWRRHLICHEVCPDLMCNTQLGKPFAIEDFYRVKNILRRLKSCVQFI